MSTRPGLLELADEFDDLSELQWFIDTLPFYVLLIDKNHMILLANKATQKVLKLHPGQLVGRYCPEVMHGVKKFPGCPLEEAVQTNQAVARELFDNRSGRWMSCVIYPSAHRTKDGRTIYIHMLNDIHELKQTQESLEKSYEKLLKITQQTGIALAAAIEQRDPYTAGHQHRVTDLCGRIGKEMNLPENQITGLKVSASVHDIGKLHVPTQILTRPGIITKTEFGIIKTHAEAGYHILKDVEFPWPVAKIVLQHHERMNGSGYPQGLKEGEILLEARIVGVADVVEAMSSHRPYRPPLGVKAALSEISQNRGILYDPAVVRACLKLFTKKGYKFK